MKIEELRIGMKVSEVATCSDGHTREGMAMEVVGIFKDGTVHLDFKGNEGDVWEADVKDLKVKL